MISEERSAHFDARMAEARVILSHCEDLNNFARKLLESTGPSQETNDFARWIYLEGEKMKAEVKVILQELEEYNAELQTKVEDLLGGVVGKYDDEIIKAVPHRILDFVNSLLGSK